MSGVITVEALWNVNAGASPTAHANSGTPSGRGRIEE